jgi:hypothetical protein
MKLDNTMLILMAVAALPVPMIVFGESIAQRNPDSKFTAWWRKHMVEREQ